MKVDIWTLTFFFGFIFYVAIRGVFENRAKKLGGPGAKPDAVEIALLVPVGIASLLLPIVFIFTDWLSFADYNKPAYLSGLGTVLMLVSLVLFYRSHADLGANWSATLAIRDGHKLVTDGVYKRVRHPMYSAIFLWDISQGLLLSNWLAGWAAIITFALLFAVRVPREERMMLEKFGTEYLEYSRKAGRLVPRIFNSSVSAEKGLDDK